MEEERLAREERRLQFVPLLYSAMQRSELVTAAIVSFPGTVWACQFVRTCCSSARNSCACQVARQAMKRIPFNLRPAVSSNLERLAAKGDADLTLAAISYVRQNKISLWSHAVLAAIIGHLATRSRRLAVRAAMLYLADDDPCARWQALSLIGRYSDSADACAGVVPAVFASCQDRAHVVREAAVLTLRKVAPLDRLVAATVGRRRSYREIAIAALGPLVKEHRSRVMAALFPYLGDQEAATREHAALALAHLCERGSVAALSVILSCLDDDAPLVRKALVESLGSIAEKDDARAVSALVLRLQDGTEDEHVQLSSVAALCSVARAGNPAAVSAMTELLEHGTQDVRRAAERAIDILADGGTATCIACQAARQVCSCCADASKFDDDAPASGYGA